MSARRRAKVVPLPTLFALLALAGCTLKTQALHGQAADQVEFDHRDCAVEAQGVPIAVRGNPHPAVIAPNLRELTYVSCLIVRGYEVEVPVTVNRVGIGYGVPNLAMKVRADRPTTDLEVGTALATCATAARAMHASLGEGLGSQAVSTFGLALVNPHRAEDERVFIDCMAERGFSAK
jgi:hypothetical protein